MKLENDLTIRAVMLKDGKTVTVEQPLEESNVELCTDEELNEMFSELIQEKAIIIK